jgi:NPCBM/NEW2 domain-containing protein
MRPTLPNRCLAVWLLFAGSAFAQAPAKPGPQLVLLDGSAVPFQTLEIAAGKLSGTGVPADLSLDDLRRIEVASQPAAVATPAVVVELRGGGKLLAKNVTLGDDKCRVEWTAGEPLALPIDVVRAIRLDPATASPDFEKALNTPSAELDRIFLKDEMGKLSSVTGLIDSLTAEQLTFEAAGQSRNVPRSRLYGIVVSQPAAAATLAKCLLTLTDGSLIGGESLALTGGKATLSLAGGGEAQLPWSAVSRVTLWSSRVAFLSDLKPVAEEHSAVVTLARAAQRDKNVLGKPLTLGTRGYDKGLGVHARSSLTFAAEGKWDVLAATVGLDAAAAGKGDCVFTILADGQSVFTRRMKGQDPPHELSVPITGKGQITLLVEPGEGLDLADLADWCDVRFVKNR